MLKTRKSKKIIMSYKDRLFGYERDKQKLVSEESHLPADEFAEKLKALQEKWGI